MYMAYRQAYTLYSRVIIGLPMLIKLIHAEMIQSYTCTCTCTLVCYMVIFTPTVVYIVIIIW